MNPSGSRALQGPSNRESISRPAASNGLKSRTCISPSSADLSVAAAAAQMQFDSELDSQFRADSVRVQGLSMKSTDSLQTNPLRGPHSTLKTAQIDIYNPWQSFHPDNQQLLTFNNTEMPHQATENHVSPPTAPLQQHSLYNSVPNPSNSQDRSVRTPIPAVSSSRPRSVLSTH